MLELWTSALGVPQEHEVSSAYASAGLGGDAPQRPLSYTELEAVLLSACIDRGLVTVPSEW